MKEGASGWCLVATLSLDGSLKSTPVRRGLGAADTGTGQALKSDRGSLKTRQLGRGRVVSGEGDLDGGVVDDESGSDVLVQ